MQNICICVKMVKLEDLQPAFPSRSGHHDSSGLIPSNYCLNSADGNFLDSFHLYIVPSMVMDD